eukprot:TRINITY_DN2298_c1_g1_i2.p1 TRINITY_DN2298_c1_g1~~TRINITY_DN2298_c1_g1_i2.p1  ORF type:complete len:376 (+),score=63.31 TRINITY_DN2298_c1_g1_i2:328-1455(+)
MWKTDPSVKHKEKENKSKKAKDLDEQGMQLMQKKHDYAAAVEKFTEAISLHPASSTYFFHRGNCYRYIQEHKRALFDYTMAIQIVDDDKKKPEDEKRRRNRAMYYHSRGICFRNMGKLEDSVNDFTHAIHLEPNNGMFWYNLGLTYYDMGDKEQAIAAYTKALDLIPLGRPNRFKPYFHRGNTHRELDNLDQSIDDLKNAVELDDRNAMAQNNLGLSYFEKGDYKNSVHCFAKAIELDGKKAVFYNNRGLAFFRLQRYEESLGDFNDAIRLDDNNANIYFNRGNSYLAIKRYEDAINDFDEAISRVSDDEDNYYCKGIVYQEMKNVPAAIEQFKLSLNVNPDFIPALFHLGLMLLPVNGMLYPCAQVRPNRPPSI